MKRFIAILFVVVLTLILIRANAQGKGNGHAKGHEKQQWKNSRNDSDRHESTDYYSYDNDGRHNHDSYSTQRVRRHVVVDHHHTNHCAHHIVVQHYERPRYVYYRDYDVYFDQHRNVYISFTKGSWTISRTIPARLHHIDMRTVVCHDVNYFDDDFTTYLDRGRPMYTNIYVRR